MKQLVLLLNLVMFFSVNLYCENTDFSMFSDFQQFYAPVKHAAVKHKIHSISLKKHNGKSFLDLSKNTGYNDEALLFDSKDSSCTAPVFSAPVTYGTYTDGFKRLSEEIRQYGRDPGTQQRK
jgi:hypothetical protein